MCAVFLQQLLIAEVINEAQRSIKDIEEAITQAQPGSRACDETRSILWLAQVEGCQTRLVHMRYARSESAEITEIT